MNDQPSAHQSIPLSTLKPGDLLPPSTVIRISQKTKAYYLDCNVSRSIGLSRGGGKEKVIGRLSFYDSIDGETLQHGDDELLSVKSFVVGDIIQYRSRCAIEIRNFYVSTRNIGTCR